MEHRYRRTLRVEELEQRAVPAAVGGHLTGSHALRTTLTAQTRLTPFLPYVGTSPVTLEGRLGAGLLGRARVLLDAAPTATFEFSGIQPNIIPGTFAGVLDFAGTPTLVTKQGTVRTQDSGSITILTHGKLLPGLRKFVHRHRRGHQRDGRVPRRARRLHDHGRR
jgi:hypothetical protein